jgi:hypothetical protein
MGKIRTLENEGCGTQGKTRCAKPTHAIPTGTGQKPQGRLESAAPWATRNPGAAMTSRESVGTLPIRKDSENPTRKTGAWGSDKDAPRAPVRRPARPSRHLGAYLYFIARVNELGRDDRAKRLCQDEENSN